MMSWSLLSTPNMCLQYSCTATGVSFETQPPCAVMETAAISGVCFVESIATCTIFNFFETQKPNFQGLDFSYVALAFRLFALARVVFLSFMQSWVKGCTILHAIVLVWLFFQELNSNLILRIPFQQGFC